MTHMHAGRVTRKCVPETGEGSKTPPVDSHTRQIVRTLCVFSREPAEAAHRELRRLEGLLVDHGFLVQTVRICSPAPTAEAVEEAVPDRRVMLSLGTVPPERVETVLPGFLASERVSFNVDLTAESVSDTHVELLRRIIAESPGGTFRFAYVFNHVSSSPYFPSARYEQDGFSLGFQATDLSADCASVEEWLAAVRRMWCAADRILGREAGYLGIDSSIAPLFDGPGSLVRFLERLGLSLPRSVTSDVYLRMTSFITEENPRPTGLCGLMLPCLEDFALASEYDRGEFPIERNLFVSLHSGLGIDTYPLGIDEDPKRIVEILRLVQGLARKHRKPLSVRFVSDGRACVGERTDFGNQYLQDVVIRPL